MRIGFIGTGAITEAVVVGLFRCGGYTEEVLLSLRSSERSQRLENLFSNVTVVSDLQTLVDRSDWIFLSVLPDQAESVLDPLRFRADQKLISLVAGLTIGRIRSLAAPVTQAHRIIPMPPIEFGIGPIPIFPYDDALARFFEPIGTPIPVQEEAQIATLSTGSSVMGTFYELEARVAGWMEAHGLEREASASYTAALLHALAVKSSRVNAEELGLLSSQCCTPGGLNEQVLRECRETGWFDVLGARLDRIWNRLHDDG